MDTMLDMFPALTAAYRDYLNRMYDESDELIVFDQFTVPFDTDIDSPALREFGDFV